MLKKITLSAILLGLPLLSYAQSWEAGLGYSKFSASDIDFNVSLGAAVGHVRYRIETDNNLNALFGVRLGTGVGDDTFGINTNNGFDQGRLSFNVELDRFVSLDGRFNFDFGENAYGFIQVSYATAVLSSSLGDTEDDWEFGGGAGIGYRFNETWSAEASYESFDGTKVTSANIILRF